VVVSARKYDENQYLKVNFANLVVFMIYFSGASQQTMVSAFKNLIYHPKILTVQSYLFFDSVPAHLILFYTG